MGRERSKSSLLGRAGGPGTAVKFMTIAGRCCLILALTSFYWIYFNAWRHLFLPMLLRSSLPAQTDLSRAGLDSGFEPTAEVDAGVEREPGLGSESPVSTSTWPLPPAAYVLLVLVLHGPLGMFLWSYYLTSAGGPGYVPKDWNPELEDAQVGKQVLWCSACSAFRPERAHHCRYCQRCVLMMDHHCPWIQNCVGYHNAKPFFLFLFYGIVSCSSFFYLFYKRYQEMTALNQSQDSDFVDESTDSKTTAKQDVFGVWSSMVLLGVYIFFMLCLFNDHVRLIARNKTFIDYLKIYSNPLMAKMAMSWGNSFRLRHKRSEDDDNRFDLGTVSNIRYFLGDNVLMWFWPTSPRGSGFSFPMRRGRSAEPTYDTPGESYDLRRR